MITNHNCFVCRENDTWQCLLCMNFADIPDNVLGEKKESELSPRERKIAERLVLELYCQFEPSIPFREVISADVSNNYRSNLLVFKMFSVTLRVVNLT